MYCDECFEKSTNKQIFLESYRLQQIELTECINDLRFKSEATTNMLLRRLDMLEDIMTGTGHTLRSLEEHCKNYNAADALDLLRANNSTGPKRGRSCVLQEIMIVHTNRPAAKPRRNTRIDLRLPRINELPADTYYPGNYHF